MSGDDKSMSEILGEIRALSRGETPPPCKEPETPKIGRRAWMLALPAMIGAGLLFAELNRWLGLSREMFGDFATLMSLVMMADIVAEARPASRRHWMVLGGTVLLAAVSSAVAAVSVSWFIVRFASEYSEGALSAFGLFFVCAAAVLLTMLIVHRLTLADNLIFPSDANEIEGDGV